MRPIVPVGRDRVEVGRGSDLQDAVGVLAHRAEEARRLPERLAQRSLGLTLELDEDRADLEADASRLEQRQPGPGETLPLAEAQLAVAELEQEVEMGVCDHGGSLGGAQSGGSQVGCPLTPGDTRTV